MWHWQWGQPAGRTALRTSHCPSLSSEPTNWALGKRNTGFVGALGTSSIYISYKVKSFAFREHPCALWRANTKCVIKTHYLCLACNIPEEWLPFSCSFPSHILHWSRMPAWQWQSVVTVLFSCCQGMCLGKGFTVGLPAVKSDIQNICFH